MDDTSLTQEQRQLAAANHNLIYRFAHQRNVNLEEMYGVLAIALCNAAKTFDKQRGVRFSTLAFQCMSNAYKMYWRHELNGNHFPPGTLISYNALINSEDSDYLSIITNKTGNCVMDTGRIETEEFVQSLSQAQQKSSLLPAGRLQGSRNRETHGSFKTGGL